MAQHNAYTLLAILSFKSHTLQRLRFRSVYAHRWYIRAGPTADGIPKLRNVVRMGHRLSNTIGLSVVAETWEREGRVAKSRLVPEVFALHSGIIAGATKLAAMGKSPLVIQRDERW